MMNNRSLPQEAIDYIKASGYRVYMRNRADSYGLFADDTTIAYVQFEPWAGYTVATVHYPNRESGTGYQVARHISTLTKEVLQQALHIHVPHEWRFHQSPRKYSGIEAYRARGAFEADYKEV